MENEAARRHVPKTVVVRELLDGALTGGGRGSFDADPSVRDVGADGAVRDVVHDDDVVHDVVGLEDGDPRDVHPGGVADVGGGEPRARVPEVEVVDPGGRLSELDPRADARGRHAHYVDPGYSGEAAGVPRCGARPYVDPARAGGHMVEERVAVDAVRAAVGNLVGGGQLGAYVPSAGRGGRFAAPGVRGFRPRPAAPLMVCPPGVTLPGGMHAQMVSEGADSKSLVVSGGAVSAESGVIVMLPGAGPGGTMGAVRVPLASYVKGQHGPPAAAGGFFSGLPGFVKYGMVAFGVLAALLGFVYLGSSFVANRYEFREVEIAPGRVIFYRVDKWTGEMERYQSGVRGYGERGAGSPGRSADVGPPAGPGRASVGLGVHGAVSARAIRHATDAMVTRPPGRSLWSAP